MAKIMVTPGSVMAIERTVQSQAAAMEGITEVTPLQAPLDESGSLPESLEEAISLAEKSAFIREVLPENVIDAYLAEKKKTAARFEADANAVFQQHLRTI